jgi:hypothetical protein
MFVTPQQKQQPPYQQNQLSRHQRLETQNSLTLSDEGDSEKTLLMPGLSRDVQLLVSDSSDSNTSSDDRGVENVQDGSPATTWATIPPGL